MPSMLNRIRAWWHMREYLRAEILSTLHCSGGGTDGVHLQTTERPPQFFLLSMQSDRLGIMRTVKCTPYSDFGTTCFNVKGVWTEYYQNRD